MKTWKQFNEAKSETQIYFSHPKDTFKTAVEEKAIELINLYFDTSYLENFGEWTETIKIEGITTLVVLPYSSGEIDQKISNDINFADSKGMDIYYLNPKKYQLKKVDKAFFSDKLNNDVENDLDKYFE